MLNEEMDLALHFQNQDKARNSTLCMNCGKIKKIQNKTLWKTCEKMYQ